MYHTNGSKACSTYNTYELQSLWYGDRKWVSEMGQWLNRDMCLTKNIICDKHPRCRKDSDKKP